MTTEILPGTGNKQGDVLGGRATGFATKAGFGAAITAITGAVIAGYPIMRKNKLPFFRVMDAAAIGLPLGIVIGRIGDLVIGDHLGKPTSWLLAFRYSGGKLSGYDCTSIPGTCSAALNAGKEIQTITAHAATLVTADGTRLAQGVGVHQTALYDFVSTMGLVLLVVYLNRRPRRMGVLFLTFATWYGTVRIITDFLRVDKRFVGLTGSQWGSVLVVSLCLLMLARFALRPKDGGEGAGTSPEEPATEAEAGGPQAAKA